jgi:hypothetical protein
LKAINDCETDDAERFIISLVPFCDGLFDIFLAAAFMTDCSSSMCSSTDFGRGGLAIDHVPDLFLSEKHLALERPRMVIVVLELFDAVAASIAFSRKCISHFNILDRG